MMSAHLKGSVSVDSCVPFIWRERYALAPARGKSRKDMTHQETGSKMRTGKEISRYPGPQLDRILHSQKPIPQWTEDLGMKVSRGNERINRQIIRYG